MLSRFGRIVALAVLVAALAPPATAFHNPAPVLAEESFTGNAWVSYRIVVSQPARIDLEAESSFAGQPVYIATFARTTSGQSRGAGLFGFSGGDTYLHAEVMEQEVIDQRNGSGTGSVGGAIGNTFPPGEYHAVIAVASPAEVRGKFRVFAQPGVSLTGRNAGGGAFLFLTPDFGGTANVSAEVGGTLGGRAILEGGASRSVAGSLFAWFIDLTFPASVTRMGYDGPEGARDGRTFYVIDGAAAGDYTFRVDASVGASALFRPEIAAMGAGVALP